MQPSQKQPPYPTDLPLSSQISSTLDQHSLQDFHREFLKDHSIQGIKITDSLVVAKDQQEKEHTVYQIEVMTDQLTYHVQRRFREFYALFKSIRKYLPSESQFPKKNYNPFVSSVNPSIIQERTSKLNSSCSSMQTFYSKSLGNVSDKRDKREEFLPLSCYPSSNSKVLVPHSEFYEGRLNKEFQKSTSEKGSLSRFKSFRGHSSEKASNSFGQHSLQMSILLINEPTNPGRYLRKLEQTIKRRKYCASRQQIRLIFIGFDEYEGLLGFALQNSLQSNRITALETLVDLIQPESNIYYQKYHKVLEDVGIECWTVEDFLFFQTPLFKLLYFQLLVVYCSLSENNHLRTENHILKTLFLFHQYLINDYLQWKKMNYKTNTQSETEKQTIEWTSKGKQTIEWTSKGKIPFPKEQQPIYQTVKHQLSGVNIYYYPSNNLLIITFSSTAQMNQLSTRTMKWHRFVDNYSLNQFTGLYKYCMVCQNKPWYVRVKVEQEVSPKSKLLPEDHADEVGRIIMNSHFRMAKGHAYEIYSDYEQEIWAQQREQLIEVAILLQVARDVQIFQGSLLPFAINFAEDALASLG